MAYFVLPSNLFILYLLNSILSRFFLLFLYTKDVKLIKTYEYQ